MRKEYKERLAKEYRYAADRMEQEPQLAKKLFYFSVFFGEAQRVLNWEWNRNLVLIQLVTQQTYTQLNMAIQTQLFKQLPVESTKIADGLTKAASDLAGCYEKPLDKDNEALFDILGRIAEVGYAAGGNGSYLYEKGIIKL